MSKNSVPPRWQASTAQLAAGSKGVPKILFRLLRKVMTSQADRGEETCLGVCCGYVRGVEVGGGAWEGPSGDKGIASASLTRDTF